MPQCFRLLTPSHGSTSSLRQKRSFILFSLHADVSYFLCWRAEKGRIWWYRKRSHVSEGRENKNIGLRHSLLRSSRASSLFAHHSKWVTCSHARWQFEWKWNLTAIKDNRLLQMGGMAILQIHNLRDSWFSHGRFCIVVIWGKCYLPFSSIPEHGNGEKLALTHLSCNKEKTGYFSCELQYS